MAVTYYALLTTIGANKLASATAQGRPLKVTHLAVGDGGGSLPSPDASRTALVNEVRRAPLNQLSIDPANNAQIVAEQIIPADVGGWWIREMGLYDDSGSLVAYANCAPSYKPQLAEGSGRTQTVRMVLIIGNTSAVDLKFDASLVLATRDYVDSSVATAINRLDYKQSVRVATTANISLSGLLTVDSVALQPGDRVLVKNQTVSADNGIYVVASGPWKRALDADESSEVTSSLIVSVESGAAQADSIWQLTTDGPVTLGVSSLAFLNVVSGRLLNIQVLSVSGTQLYAPTPGTRSILVEMIGGGGGSAGCAATAADQTGLTCPGGNGAYAMLRLNSGFDNVTLTVGAGGLAGSSTQPGGNGGTTSFGALASCPGGKGSLVGGVSSTTPIASYSPGHSGEPVGTGIIKGFNGGTPNNTLQVVWGVGTGFLPVRTAPISGGLGGSGVFRSPSGPALAGNPGEVGRIIIQEFA